MAAGATVRGAASLEGELRLSRESAVLTETATGGGSPRTFEASLDAVSGRLTAPSSSAFLQTATSAYVLLRNALISPSSTVLHTMADCVCAEPGAADCAVEPVAIAVTPANGIAHFRLRTADTQACTRPFELSFVVIN
eukprot:6194735-Pleurochrysis_carterae.AAC.3